MNNKIFNIVFKLIFFLLFAFLLVVSIKANISDSSLIFLQHSETFNKSTFISLLDYSSNAYYMWRFNDIILWICYFFNKISNVDFNSILYFTNLFIFFIFTTVLTKNLNKNLTFLVSSFISANLSFLITYLFGNKTFLITSITFLPFFIYSLIKLYECNKLNILNILLVILSSILLINSSNELSFLYLVFSIIVLSLLGIKKNLYSKIFNSLIVLIFLYSIYYISFIVPKLPSFDYPWYAKVVQDDGIPGIIRPLFTESSTIPFIDEISEKCLYAPYVFFLSLFFLFITYKFFISRNNCSKKLSIFLVFFVISFFLEIFTAPGLSSLLFFKTIWRVTPSIFNISFYPIFLFLMIFVFYILVVLNIRAFTFLFLLNFLLCTIVFSDNYKSLLIKNDSLKLINTIKENDYYNSSYKNIILSPSIRVINDNGFNYLIKKDMYLDKNIYRNIKLLKPTLTSNYGEKSLNQVLNKNEKKRYSTFKGKQTGDEWIKISLSNNVNINGVMVEVGAYKTDFPTSIVIKDCNDNIIKKQNNLGLIQYTESNLPYYGGQDKMTILFDNTINTNCIKIFQTGKNNNFEWSIAQIKFLLPDLPRKDVKNHF